jgi:hypothetical protein
MTRRSQAGTVATGAVEEVPEGTAWRDSKDLGRRIIGKMMNQRGASRKPKRRKPPRPSLQ